MDNNIVALKICTLFHDPPFKSIMIRKGKGDEHKEVAEELLTEISDSFGKLRNLIRSSTYNPIIEYADWVASSIDRCLISELYKGVVSDIYFVNILNSFEQKNLNYLSDEILDFKKWINNFKEKFKDKLKKILKNVNELPPNILYHAIWRSLIPLCIYSSGKPEFALLPADTRVPYYTIFDHLYIASGLIPCLNEGNKLGMIHWETVGTQSFIQGSRAFRDMWASSFLISLMNTAIIIKLANEYGFDSIIAPNMLFNTIVDLYLSVYLDEIKVDLESIRFPTTPDKGFAFVPYTRVDYYVNVIPKWFNEVWNRISNGIKKYIEKVLEEEYSKKDLYIEMLKEHIKEQTGKEEIDLNEYIEIRNKNYWETLWSEASKYSPIRLVCVCEKINLDPDKMEKLMESIPSPVFAYFKYEGEDAENAKKRISMELKRLREFAKKYDPKYQFYEFAILMEFLKMKRKIISEEPRINTDPIFLKDILIIKDKRVFCSVCHVRPAVTFYTEKVRKKLPMIKEGERLCPVCLTKRMLATLRFREEGKVDEDSPLIRIILEVFKWIDGTEDGSKYAKALQKAAKIYYERFSKVYYNAAKMYYGEFPKVDTQLSSPFIIPSLDSISTLLFRISAMRVLDSSEATRFLGLINDFTKQLYKPKTEEESIEMILRDFPSIKLIEIENLSTNLPLYFVGGEWLIKEEIERMARDHGIKLDENKLKEYEDILKSVGEKVEKHKYSNAIARRPGKYVALIRGDGDNMGKLLSLTGKYLKKVHEVIPLELKEYLERDKYEKLSNFVYFATPSYYSMSSRVLSIIAKKISEISDEYYTMMIYSGGDDVLAFSTPETSLQFCYHARKLFSQNYIEINDETLFKSEIIVPGLTENATQSYSIHLMHVFTPVSINLLDSLIELNEYAKEGGKNSFVLSYVPRGGGGVLTKLPWYIKGIVEYLMNFISITLDFPTMIRLEDKKIIKSKLKVSHRAYRDFIEICEVNEGLSKDVTRSLFEYEIKRHMINDKIEELYKIIPMDQIYCFPIEIKGNVSNLAIELAKASIILRDSMDSNPIMFSEKL